MAKLLCYDVALHHPTRRCIFSCNLPRMVMSARLRPSKMLMSFPATLITWGISVNVKLLGQLQTIPWILHASFNDMLTATMR